jgi:hypothetical protein
MYMKSVARKVLLTGFIFNLAYAFFFPCSCLAERSSSGWKLVQRSRVQGKQNIWIRRDAIKIQNENKGVTILMKAPDWKVYVWSDNNGVMTSTPIGKWSGLHSHISEPAFAEKYSGAVESEDRVGLMCGLNTHRVSLCQPDHDYTNDIGQTLSMGKMRRIGNYWTTDGFSLPPIVCAAVQRYYGDAPSKRFPLQYMAYSKAGNTVTDLSTPGCEGTTISDAVFAIPRNYRQARTDEEVMFSKFRQDVIKDIAQ